MILWQVASHIGGLMCNAGKFRCYTAGSPPTLRSIQSFTWSGENKQSDTSGEGLKCWDGCSNLFNSCCLHWQFLNQSMIFSIFFIVIILSNNMIFMCPAVDIKYSCPSLISQDQASAPATSPFSRTFYLYLNTISCWRLASTWSCTTC